VTEELPPDMPTPIMGKTVQITIYVDADHAHDQVMRRPVMGILLLVNNTLINGARFGHLGQPEAGTSQITQSCMAHLLQAHTHNDMVLVQ